MPQVDFGDQQYGRSQYGVQKKPPLISFMMKIGLAKSEKSANIVLLIIAAVAVALTVWFLSTVFGSPEVPPAPPADEAFLDEQF